MRIKNKLYILYTALFMAACALPGAAMLLGVKAGNYENRMKKTMPYIYSEEMGVNLKFPDEFEAFFADNFGFREQMVTALNLLTAGVFSDTPSEKAVVGKEGYLFFSETLHDYTCEDVISDATAYRIARILALQQEYAQGRGMRFVFTVAPNKNSVYPEYMPQRILSGSGPNNLAKLSKALEDMGVNYLDLKAELTAHKGEKPLYYHEDTHWNDLGALIAYRAVMKSVAPDILDYERYTDISPEVLYDHGGDLHNFIYPALPGNSLRYRFPISKAYKSDRPVNLERDITTGTVSGKNSFKLLMFRDSFGIGLFPFLSNNLGRAFYSTEFPYHYALLDKEKPDALLIEIVERNIPELAAQAPFMSAAVRKLSGERAGSISAEAAIGKNKVGVSIFGLFDPAQYDPAEDSLIVRLSGAQSFCFEAFPVTEASLLKKAAALYGEKAAEAGFSLTLPEGLPPGDYGIALMVVRGDTYLESGTLGKLGIE